MSITSLMRVQQLRRQARFFLNLAEDSARCAAISDNCRAQELMDESEIFAQRAQTRMIDIKNIIEMIDQNMPHNIPDRPNPHEFDETLRVEPGI